MKNEIKRTVFKEIIVNLKLLLVCCLLTLLFYLIYYPLYNPAKQRNHNSIVCDENDMKEDVQKMSGVDTSYIDTSYSELYIGNKEDHINTVTDRYTGDFAQEYTRQQRGLGPVQYEGRVGLNDSPYDAQITSATQLDNLDETRMEFFKEDIQSKVIYCFIISFSILILGRYIYLFMNWLKKDSE